VVSQFLDIYTNRYQLSKFSLETKLQKHYLNHYKRKTHFLGAARTRRPTRVQRARAPATQHARWPTTSAAHARKRPKAGEPARAQTFCRNALELTGNSATTMVPIHSLSTYARTPSHTLSFAMRRSSGLLASVSAARPVRSRYTRQLGPAQA
jgi:hypothetical protein